MKPSKASKLVLFALLSIGIMPFAQAQLASALPAFAGWSSMQLTLVLMYTTPAWAVAVLIFIQDGFRAEAMQETPASAMASARKLGLLALLTNAIALAINPVAAAAGPMPPVALALCGAAVGILCGGLLWPQLNKPKTETRINCTTVKTKSHG